MTATFYVTTIVFIKWEITNKTKAEEIFENLIVDGDEQRERETAGARSHRK